MIKIIEYDKTTVQTLFCRITFKLPVQIHHSNIQNLNPNKKQKHHQPNKKTCPPSQP